MRHRDPTRAPPAPAPLPAQESRVFQDVEPPYRGTAPGSLLALVGFVGLCLLVGLADAAVSAGSVRSWYLSLTPPPLTPPHAMFAPVWQGLYVVIGIAGWLVWRRAGHARALRIWGWLLLINALWSPAFFGLHSPALGLVVIAAMLAMTVLTMRAFRRKDRVAAALMVPYGIWVTFAAYLNLGFWWLNRA